MAKEPRYTLTVRDVSADDVATLLMLLDRLDDVSPWPRRGFHRKVMRQCTRLLHLHQAWRRLTFYCAGKPR
jgi:hypothetical protein